MSSLSDKDREVLARMEMEFSKEDPKFAETMATAHRFEALTPRKVVIGLLIIVAGIAVVIGSLVANLMPLAILGFGVMVAGGMFMFRGPGKMDYPGMPRQPKQTSAFMRRLEDKWEKRRETEY